MAATDRAVNGLARLKIRRPRGQEAAAAFGVLLDGGVEDPEGFETSDFEESDLGVSDFEESDFEESFDASALDSEPLLAAASEEPFFDPDDAERLSFL